MQTIFCEERVIERTKKKQKKSLLNQPKSMFTHTVEKKIVKESKMNYFS